MTNCILKASFLAALVCAAVASASAQDQSRRTDEQGNEVQPTRSSSSASAARVPVIIIGSAAKATWVTTKFATKHLAAPVAKTIFLKATPTLAKLALKHGLPYAARLSLL